MSLFYEGLGLDWRIAMGFLGLLLCLPLAALGQDAKTKDDFAYKVPTDQEMAEMQKRWQETFVPGKHHRWLGQLIGDWETTAKFLWGGEGSPTSESKGSSRIRWRVEGKWLSWEDQANMMGADMQVFSVLGYDNFKQKFVGDRFDSLGTALYTFEGNLGIEGKTLRLWGTLDEPMTGENDKMAMYVVRLVDEDHFVYEVHDLVIGGDKTKVIEVDYVRRKQ